LECRFLRRIVAVDVSVVPNAPLFAHGHDLVSGYSHLLALHIARASTWPLPCARSAGSLRASRTTVDGSAGRCDKPHGFVQPCTGPAAPGVVAPSEPLAMRRIVQELYGCLDRVTSLGERARQRGGPAIAEKAPTDEVGQWRSSRSSRPRPTRPSRTRSLAVRRPRSKRLQGS